MGEWWSSRSPVLKYSVYFGLFMLIFYIFYSLPYTNQTLVPVFIKLQAQLSGAMLNLFGYDVTVTERVISGAGNTVSIEKGCDGAESIALLAGAILVFPLAFRLKWPGLLAGVGVLLFLNILRIAGLYLTGIHWPAGFDLLHEHGGFVLFTTFSVLLVITWINWAIKKTAANHEA